MNFGKAKWIWRDGEAGNDEYVDFLSVFDGALSDMWRLKISCDSNYAVYIDGELAAFGQYADYPDYKVGDTVDVSRYVHAGKCRMVITVWYYGEDSQTYKHGDAGLIFELTEGERIVEYSGEHTLSRLSHDYDSHLKKRITSQLGFTFCYNSTQNDGYLLNCDAEFAPSRIELDRSTEIYDRPIEKLILRDGLDGRVVEAGAFKYTTKEPSECAMRDAELFPDEGDANFPRTLCAPSDRDGVYLIVDLGRETAGFIELGLCVERECVVDIGFGEHLIDGRCRTKIGNRAFVAKYIARTGENRYMNPFRRFGCRYLQFFISAGTARVDRLTIRPTEYPVRDVGVRPKDELRARIYDVCVNTLRQCMHEHYEDCPWREQALYTMDSRNQMLCGAYAFGESSYPFARASLVLISHGMRSDGLLSLCYPAGLDYPIPSFSLIYFIQVREYLEYSNDPSLAFELYPFLTRLMKTFTDHIDDSGLLPGFAGLWNFYEWSDGMSGRTMHETDQRYEAPLCAFLSMALSSLGRIADAVGEHEDASKYRGLSRDIAERIAGHFYVEGAGLFASFDGDHSFSVLTNALCVLCGASDHVEGDHITELLLENGLKGSQFVTIPCTLSMNTFRFDALIKRSRSDAILDIIDRDYSYMLDHGATSFWETIKGAEDFGGAGSLCHGWSALPIYYFSTLA